MRFVYAKVKQISDIFRQIYKKYRDLAYYKLFLDVKVINLV